VHAARGARGQRGVRIEIEARMGEAWALGFHQAVANAAWFSLWGLTTRRLRGGAGRWRPA
jgi:hypothetical protein